MQSHESKGPPEGANRLILARTPRIGSRAHIVVNQRKMGPRGGARGSVELELAPFEPIFHVSFPGAFLEAVPEDASNIPMGYPQESHSPKANHPSQVLSKGCSSPINTRGGGKK